MSGSNNCFKSLEDFLQVKSCKRTCRDNDDNEEDDDADNQAHAHLHILPPHLFPDSVCSSSETLGRDSEVICLILQRV